MAASLAATDADRAATTIPDGTTNAPRRALVGLGIPEYEAKRYESFLNKGGSLLSVHADDGDWAKRAKTILERCGAKGIDKTSEASGTTEVRSTAPQSRHT